MILLHFAAASLYAAAAAARWPRTVESNSLAHRLAMALLPAAIAVHAVVITRSIVTPDGLDLSFANALSLVGGLAVIVAWVSGLLRTLPGVATIVLAVAAVCALAPMGGESPHRFPYATDTWAALHIGVALIAYALFVVAAMQAVVLTGLEQQLRQRLPTDPDPRTPPLLTLERFLFRLVGLGFVLLTLTLGSGFLFSGSIFGKPITFTHKNFFSVLGWAAFAVLLFGRWRYGWRGRRALKWILAGTALLILGYLGSKFVSEIVLGR